jgi:hypothetical protein
MDTKDIEPEGVEGIQVAHAPVQWRYFINAVMTLMCCIKVGIFLTSRRLLASQDGHWFLKLGVELLLAATAKFCPEATVWDTFRCNKA